MRIRDATPADHPAVHAINQSAAPAMNLVERSFFDVMAAHAAVFLVAEGEAGDVMGFLLAFPPGAPYDSPNYRWFETRHDRFVYVDRVAVDPAARGRGVGRALYAGLDAALGDAAGETVVCCEVNLRPPNPGSLEFHRRLGFEVVGEQDTEAGAKRVALMSRWAGAADR